MIFPSTINYEEMWILKICAVPWETNDESNQWHELPAIVKFNLKSILVFVKHPQ